MIAISTLSTWLLAFVVFVLTLIPTYGIVWLITRWRLTTASFPLITGFIMLGSVFVANLSWWHILYRLVAAAWYFYMVYYFWKVWPVRQSFRRWQFWPESFFKAKET